MGGVHAACGGRFDRYEPKKQKAEAKIARRRATEWRQSHEKPTKRQLSYYSSLCFKYKEEKVDLNDKSKLDLKNLISEILEKHGKNDEL